MSAFRATFVLALAVAAAVPVATPAYATADVTTRRLAGADRYATAAAIASTAFPTGAVRAILASGDRFPDALGAGYLAGTVAAPILLTSAARLPAATEAALAALGTTDVDVIGGDAVISPAVAARLVELGYTVRRLGGLDRYETSRVVAESVPATSVGALGSNGRTAIVASGEDFADALAGSPMAYAQAFPVLLTPRMTLSSQASAALSSLGIAHVLVLGGDAAIAPRVVTAIEEAGITVTRLAGADRAATATAIADFEIGTLGWSGTGVSLSAGDGFADGLTGGPLGGVQRTPLLLATSPTLLGTVTGSWLTSRNATIGAIDALGGVAAVAESTLTAAKQAATTG